jgi:PGF-pre-PGF domain-containing protein
MTLNSDGYTWTPNPVSNAAPTAETYQSSGLSETFTKSDFVYGPQIWKPTGSAGYPIYYGQDMTNTTNTFQLMFVDLNSGVLHQNAALQNQGAVRINYTFQNLSSDAVFNAYAYCQNSNAGNDMIGWTNSLTSSPSGYVVTSLGGSTVAPLAGFGANETSGTAPLTVQFNDISDNSPTSWSWNFGDGGTSTVENPVHTYTTAGTYNVTLTATNSAGSDSDTITDFITVSAGSGSSAPTPAFIATPVNGVAPLAVQFTDQTTGTPTSWLWDFGDGSTSTVENPSHTYTAAGTYTVNLTATNTGGSASLVKAGLVYVTTTTGPLSTYSGIYIRPSNHEGVQYNANNNGTYYVYAGSAGGGLNVLHVSTDPSVIDGQVTVTQNQSGTLYATSSGTYADDVILMVAVNGTIPGDFGAHITSSGYTWTPTGATPATGSITYQSSAVNETLTKNDLFYGPQDWKPTQGNANYPLFSGEDMTSSANQYQVMFIDLHAGLPGTSYTGYSSLTNQGAVRIDYTFTDLPSYATVNVYGWKSGTGMGWTNALTGTGTSGYTVLSSSIVIPPAAGFTESPAAGLAPVNVQFTDTSTGTPTSWLWNFGDGSTATTQNPVHAYSSTGTYTVSLTATNSGGSNTTTQASAVAVSAPVTNTTTCTVTNIVSTATGSTQTVSVNTTGITATTAGNYVNLTGLTGSWSNLSIDLTAPATTSGGNLTGTVSSVQAVTQPVTVPIAAVGNPNVSVSIDMTQIPSSGSSITSTITSSPNTTVQSGFTLAATDAGDQIAAIAYTVSFAKTGIANAANGGIISSATISMAASPSWVAANGGTSHIEILHQTDSGTSTLLTTQFVGTDTSGNDLFTAVSPTGLSTFALAAVSPLSSSSSSGASSSGSGFSSGADSSGSFSSTSFAITASGVAAGQAMNFAVNEGLNGNLNYGISSVSIVPSQKLSSTELTVGDAGMSLASALPSRQVAGVVQIEPVGVNPSSVSQGTITFQLSGAWMTAHSLTPDDIVMLHDVNGQWTELPTTFASQSGSTYTFTATTPGFSYFAIAGRLSTGTAAAVTTTAAPLQAAVTGSATAVPTTPFVYQITPPQTTAVPAAMQPFTTPASAAPASSSGSGSSLIGIVAAGAGIILLVAGVVLVRRWWIRKQNPTLFRKYD